MNVLMVPKDREAITKQSDIMYWYICALGDLTTIIDLCTETSVPHEIPNKIK